MLLYVRHGNDETTMFNGNCQNIVLLNYIKSSLGYKDAGEVDLVYGEPAKLSDPKTVPLGFCDHPEAVACETPGWVERGKYALVAYHTEEDGSRSYYPLLEGDDAQKLKNLLESYTAARKNAKAGARKK